MVVVVRAATDCVLRVRGTVTMILSVPECWSAALITVPSRLEDTGTTLTTAARPDVPQTDSVSRAGVPALTTRTVREVRTATMSVIRLA